MNLLVDPLTCRLVDFYSDFFSEKYLKVGIENVVKLLLFCILENYAYSLRLAVAADVYCVMRTEASENGGYIIYIKVL